MESQVASALVPQADDLDKVRVLVAHVRDGAHTNTRLVEVTGYSARHVAYRARAACVLGLLAQAGDRFATTTLGDALVATAKGSEAERLVLRRAVEAAPALAFVADALLGRKTLSRRQLAERIEGLTDMAPATALRRAGGLLSWRKRLRPRQLWLSEAW